MNYILINKSKAGLNRRGKNARLLNINNYFNFYLTIALSEKVNLF